MKDNLNHVPIIIASNDPLRLVLRETDVWNPTLDEVNHYMYDYVKLSRISCYIDIGIAPYSLAVGFDGSLIIPALPKFQNREDSINKFNETLGILLLGGVYSESVQPSDISFGHLFFDGYYRQLGGGHGYVASLHRDIQNKHIGISKVIDLINPRIIQSTQLISAYRKGKEYFDIIEKLSPNLLLNGISHYVKHQWSESLIFLWTTIEQIINIIWEKEIIRHNSNDLIIGRNKFLKDYRTWTSSTKIEMLYQKAFIDENDYVLLNKARKLRNDFVHSGINLDSKDVKHALEALFCLLSLVVSSYKSRNIFNETLDTIYKNQRGDLFPEKKVLSMNEVEYWMNVPPIPGDSNWGNKEYEIIEDIRIPKKKN